MEETKRTDYNSSVNQRIKAKLVDREVYANVGTMVEYILQKGWEDRDAPFNWEEVENCRAYPEFYGEHAEFSGGTEEARDEEVERLEKLVEDLEQEVSDIETEEEVTNESIDALKAKIEDLEAELEEADEKTTAEINNAIGLLQQEIDEEDEEIEKLHTKTEALNAKIEKINDEISELNDLEDEQQEVFEWWLVSGWLCDKLKDMGEVVIDSESIWGRCCTGQSISMDYTINKIAEEMEILEGQKYSWAETTN